MRSALKARLDESTKSVSTAGGALPSAAIHGYALLLVVAVIVTGGGIPWISQAVALAGVGALLLWKPPARMPNSWITAGLAGFLVVGILSMITPRLGGAGPTFAQLEESLALIFPATWSLQPVATLEGMILFLAGVGLLVVLWVHPLGPSGRRTLARTTVFLATLLGVGVLLGNGMNSRWVFAQEAEVFTFIPNRNQMGSVLMLAAVLAFATGMDSLKRRGSWTILGFGCCVVLVVALMQLHSRAVVVLFFLGILLWFLLRGMGRQYALYVKLGVPLTLMLFSLFLFFGETSRDRILDQLQFSEDSKEQTIEYRLLLYGDSLRMIAERPLVGFGIGNFEAVFPQFRQASYHAERVIHPDSDVFWLLAEMGLIGGLLAVIVILGVFKMLRFGSFRGADPIRLGAVTCLILFLLHSLVDVGAHRLGSLMLLVVVVALGVGRHRHQPRTKGSSLWPLGWRVAGGALILCAILWTMGGSLGLSLNRHQHELVLQKRLEQASESGDPERFVRAAAAFRRSYPISWEPYYATASGLLQLGAAGPETVEYFRIARALNPTSPRMVFHEAEAWMGVNPSRSIDAWREALRRPRDPSHDHRQRIAQIYREHPGLRPALLALSESDPELRFLLLNQLGGAAFRDELEKDLAYDEALSLYDAPHRRGLLVKYARSGGGARLLELLEENPEIAEPVFELRAMGLANTGRLREAVETIREAVPRPEIPVRDDFSSLRQLEREFADQPNDILKGILVLHRQIDERNWASALETVRTLNRNPDVPAYLHYWAGEIYFIQDDLENSWTSFLQYLRRR